MSVNYAVLYTVIHRDWLQLMHRHFVVFRYYEIYTFLKYYELTLAIESIVATIFTSLV